MVTSTHRSYTRGAGKMERLSVQLRPDTHRRVKRLAIVMRRSRADVMSQLIEARIGALELEHTAALAQLPPGAEDAE